MPPATRTPQGRSATSTIGKQKSNVATKSSQAVFATPAKSTNKTQSSTGKRKRTDDEPSKGTASKASKTQPKQQVKKQKVDGEEKRLRPFRNHAPKSFLEKLQRAQTQRMIVVGRQRIGSGSDIEEEIDIVGSTGNIYKVTIGHVPHCTCPDHGKGHECKHKVYALHFVLKAPEHLEYQRALLTDELQEIFAHAPPIPTDVGDGDEKNGKRKPIDGECPICYMELEEGGELVWCKAACGNNMHKSCFDQWARSQQGKAVRCVYCRTEWEMDHSDLEQIKKAGVIGEDGYVNVAQQFGMSGARDYSGYYQPWARRQFGYGW